MSETTLGVAWRSFIQSFQQRSQVGFTQLVALLGTVLLVILLASTVNQFGDQPLYLALIAIGAVLLALFIGDLAHAGDPLDERSFVQAGMRPSRAALSVVGASLLAPRSIVYWVAGLVTGTATGAGALGLIAGVAFGLTLIAVDRLGVMSGRALAERRVGREVRTTVGYAILLAVMPLLFAVTFLPWREALESFEKTALGPVTTIPPLSALTVAHAADPELGVASAWLGALVLLALILGLGMRTAQRVMHSVTTGGATRVGAMRGAIGSPVLVIAWRIATAWVRDARYQVLLFSVIVLPFLLLIPLALGGLPLHWLVLVPLPIFGLLLGWSLHNDVAYDSTAVWIHVTSGLPGRADRFGRALPALIGGTLLILIAGVLTAIFAGGWLGASASVVLALAFLWVSIGGSSVMSALDPYPVAQPDDSPFTQPVRSWGSAVFSQPFAGLVEVALAAPVAWFAWRAVRENSWEQLGVAAVLAVGIGIVALVIGVVIGGKIFEKRASRILEFAQATA